MEPAHGILTALLLLCIVPAAGAASLAVGIGNVTAAPGSTVTLPVTVTGAQDLGSLDLAIAYDPAVLSVVSVDKGSLGNGLFGSNTDTPGIITVSMADPVGFSGDGSVANLKFGVSGPAGSTSELTIYNILASDVKTYQEIPAGRSAGSVTVKNSGIGSPGFTVPALIAAFAVLGLLRRKNKT